jgi:hypothetical protein
VVRFGNRLELIFVLGGTATVAWLLTRNAQLRRWSAYSDRETFPAYRH